MQVLIAWTGGGAAEVEDLAEARRARHGGSARPVRGLRARELAAGMLLVCGSVMATSVSAGDGSLGLPGAAPTPQGPEDLQVQAAAGGVVDTVRSAPIAPVAFTPPAATAPAAVQQYPSAVVPAAPAPAVPVAPPAGDAQPVRPPGPPPDEQDPPVDEEPPSRPGEPAPADPAPPESGGSDDSDDQPLPFQALRAIVSPIVEPVVEVLEPVLGPVLALAPSAQPVPETGGSALSQLDSLLVPIG